LPQVSQTAISIIHSTTQSVLLLNVAAQGRILP